jgi:hypothetical protein
MIEGPWEEQTGPAERKPKWFVINVGFVIQMIKKIIKRKSNEHSDNQHWNGKDERRHP